MNTTNILAVADAIEQHTIPWLGFNLGPFFAIKEESEFQDNPFFTDQSGHECGTVACIAGHAIILKYGIVNQPVNTETADKAMRGDFLRDAADWLGIEYSGTGFARVTPGSALFFGDGAVETRTNVSADQAVRTLRHLAATGQVDWTV